MNKSTKPFIGIIILEYNNVKDTIECIDSVLNSDYENYMIVLVDNASKMRYFTELNELYGLNEKISLIRTPKNGGFGYGNNAGMKYLENFNPKYFLILGNDTIIEENTISKLLNHIENNDRIGIVVPKVLLFETKKTNRINSLGGNFCKFGFANDRFFGQKIHEIADIDNNFFYAPGSCFLVREEIAKKINYFDENIFLYWEDVDFSWRTRLIGFDIQIVPESLIYHKLSTSTGRKKNAFKVYNREFSWLYVIIKNLSLKNIIKFLPVYIIFMFAKVIFNSKNKEHFRAIIAAYLKFFVTLKENIKQHKGVQQKRKIDDKEILCLSNNGAMKQSIFYRDQG